MKKILELVKQENSIIFNGDLMNIYVPKYYFDRGLATYNGKYVNTMGMFIFEITTQEKFSSNKDGAFHTLKLPVKINFDYDSTFKIKRKINKFDSESYVVFSLLKGNIFLDNIYTERKASSCRDFVVGMLHSGSIPNFIKYDDIIKLYLMSMSITNTNLRNTPAIYETIISEICRSKSNIRIPFRKVAGKNANVDMYDYKTTNIKNIASLNSTFSDVTFEDINRSLITSVGKTLNGEKESESPIEKTIKY